MAQVEGSGAAAAAKLEALEAGDIGGVSAE